MFIEISKHCYMQNICLCISIYSKDYEISFQNIK